MANQVLKDQINEELYSKLELAYLCTDTDLNVVEASNGLKEYGYPEIPVGASVADHIDFMVGLDSETKLDLPLVVSPSGIPVTVSLLPGKDLLTILFTNASTQAEHRQALQQKANENELLLRQQGLLMAQLEQASSELERKNDALREAARLQSRFLSGVSHEFRTPLTSIIGYANLLHNDVKNLGAKSVSRIAEQDTSAEYLHAVRRSSKHLLSLVENLLDHGKLDAEEIVIRPKPCSLAEVFEDIRLLLSPLANTKQVKFKLLQDFADDTEVVADDSRLRQCLLNIVGNAVKFTDKGSVIVEASLLDENLLVKVKDTGDGISEEDLKKIRLPFYQAPDTGKAGTGLGLTITERLIELMGGEMHIESELNVGTEVRFNLPMPIMVEHAERVAVNTASGRLLSILLVEDDSDIADLVIMMLRERQVNVVHVPNGALALDAVKQENFDLILMDIHMPIMDGYQALEALKKMGNCIPVAVMSASSMSSDRLQAQEYGCAAYLIKPVEVDEIISLASQLVGVENG